MLNASASNGGVFLRASSVFNIGTVVSKGATVIRGAGNHLNVLGTVSSGGLLSLIDAGSLRILDGGFLTSGYRVHLSGTSIEMEDGSTISVSGNAPSESEEVLLEASEDIAVTSVEAGRVGMVAGRRIQQSAIGQLTVADLVTGSSLGQQLLGATAGLGSCDHVGSETRAGELWSPHRCSYRQATAASSWRTRAT